MGIRSENIQAISRVFREIESLDRAVNTACETDNFTAQIGGDDITEWLSVEERAVLRGLLLGNWHSRISFKIKNLADMGVTFDGFADRDAWIADRLARLPHHTPDTEE
jgi:hypothetical protein